MRPTTSLLALAARALTACSSTSGDGDATPAGGSGDEGSGGASTSTSGSGSPGATGSGSGGGGSVRACATDVSTHLAGMRVPGLSAGIIENGQLVCTSVAGHASIEEERPVTPDTVFAWASVSKTVTAAAVMILFDEGKLGLDDDVDGYLPFSVRNPSCPGAPITFRQLLTHTSSIVDSETIYDESYVIGDSTVPLGDFVSGYLVPGGDYYDEDENYASECPGEVNDYSNVAVGLLGHLVEQIAGMPFDQFCQERIFAPLGMEQTSFLLANLDVDNVAMPYDGDSPATFVAHGHNGFPTYPDGLLRTSVPHLARFLAMFAQLGEYQGTRILQASTVEEMRRVQIPAMDDTQGLIWFYADYGARTGLLGHDGDDPGTSSLMFFDPATGDGALLVANGYWYDADDDSPEADALLDALFGEVSDAP